MSSHIAQVAHVNIPRIAFSRLVTNLVAFEAKFFRTFKRVVSVFPAQDAIQAFAIVRTLRLEVAKLLTISALNGRILVSIVP